MDKPGRLEYLTIGRITGAHGLHGEVRVQPLTSDPGRFNQLTDCFLVSADEKQRQPVRVQNVRPGNAHLLLKLQAVDDRTAAEKLRGCYLSVNRQQAVVLPPDRWFICDLVGCAVHDESRGYLGVVSDVLQHAAQDIYVVQLAGCRDLLFPALKSILLKVDIGGQQIHVRLPDGLWELYREGQA